MLEADDALLDLLASAVPGVVPRAESADAPTRQMIQHMYKQRESVFGAVARDMVAAGWSVFPQESDGNRRPGTVNNEMIKWSERHHLATRRPDEATLAEWTAQCPHLNVAVVLGPASGHTVIVDVDVTEEDLSTQVQELAIRILGRTPLRRVGRWPKIALVYRHAPDEEIPSRSPKFAAYDAAGNPMKGDQGLEIISSGQAFTFYGKHHATGRYFRWLEGPPHVLGPGQAPLVTATQVQDFMDAVDGVRRFHKTAGIDAAVVSWEWDEGAKIHVPRIRSSEAGSHWVEDERGIVVDGREAYLMRLAARIVSANAHLALDTSGVGPEKLIRIVVEQFQQTAETSGRWRGRQLEREARSKVLRAASKIRSGEWRTSEPHRDQEGKYILATATSNYVPEQPRRGSRGALDFLPPFVDVASQDFDPRRPGQRRPIKCLIHEPARGAEKERRLSPDRTAVAAAVTDGLRKAFDAFWDEVYASDAASARVHILKAPTGAGKTSRGIRYIAEDPRTKRDFTIRGSNGEIVNEGRNPILFLLPTYANIEELRTRADTLNLDPGLSDDDLRVQAATSNLIHEDDLADRLADLRREAANAGLVTMVYQGKIRAGCRMADKVQLAMDAGIGTSGFCEAEVPTDRKDDNGRRILEKRYCPYYEECPAIRQRDEIAKCHVVFLPHAFLALQIPEQLKHARAVVADERIHHLFLHTTTFRLETLTLPRRMPKLTKAEREDDVDPAEHESGRRDAGAIVNLALTAGECPVEALARCREFDLNGHPSVVRWVKSAIRVCAASIQRDGSITPDLTVDQVKAICAQPMGKEAREEYRFWKIVEERLEQRITEIGEASLAMTIGREPPPRRTRGARDYRIQAICDPNPTSGNSDIHVRLSWRDTPNWIDRPMLLLDASAAPEIIGKIWTGKEVVVHDISAALNVRVVGIVDRTYSNAAVVAPPSSSLQEKLASAHLLDRVRNVISLLSGLYGWDRVVAGGSILVRRAVNTDWEGPSNIDWCHYGAMRGLDFAKHHAAAISIGRMELPIRTIDGLVAALTYDDDEPERPYDLLGTGLGKDGLPLRTPIGSQRIRLRSGHDVEMPVPTFPGRWGRMIQRQYREEELLQFLGRLRPVYREGDAPIWYSLSSVIPEDVIVDDLITIEDLLKGSIGKETRVWEVMRRSHGVIDADVAMATADDLYVDRDKFEAEMRAIGLDPRKGKAAGRYGRGVVAVRWTDGEGRKGVSYVRADIPDPVETLRNVRASILGAETNSVELGSASHTRTLAKGRQPDKIETELGTLPERRSREEASIEETSMGVLAMMPADAFATIRDGGKRSVPFLVRVDLRQSDDDANEDVLVPLSEFRAKADIDRLWRVLAPREDASDEKVAAQPIPIADPALADDTYEWAANHVLDIDLETQSQEYDSLDEEIPW